MRTATVMTSRALFYADGPGAALDRPAHVRAGSGVCVWDVSGQRRLAVVQDDALFVALVDLRDFRVDAVALPRVKGRRQLDTANGLKRFKPDLEACAVVPMPGGPMLVAAGSGSQAGRSVAFALADAVLEPRVLDLRALHAVLAAHPLVGGHALNLEGLAVGARGAAFLVHRANVRGSTHDVVFTVDAAALGAHLDAPGSTPPALLGAAAVNVGRVKGARLTITDACVRADGRLWVTAAAEVTDNPVDDGAVVGCCLAVVDPATAAVERVALVDTDGAPLAGKPEGICLHPEDARRAWLVMDDDDVQRPVRLLDVALPEV